MKIMNRSLFLLTVIISLLTSACTTLTNDIEVETHMDPAINIKAYKTYTWVGSAQIVFDPVGQWEQPTLDTDEEVKFAITRELRDLGISPTQNHPDLLVAYAAGIDTSAMELKENPDTAPVLQNVPKAALMVALVDANTGYLIWSGYAEGNAMQQQSIEDIRTRINYAVSEIFQSLK